MSIYKKNFIVKVKLVPRMVIFGRLVFIYCRESHFWTTAPGLGVCEWSPEGLHGKSVSLIPNTDEILKLVKKKMN